MRLPRQSGKVLTGRLAQLGERLPYKQEVAGSSPAPPTVNHAVSGPHGSRYTDSVVSLWSVEPDLDHGVASPPCHENVPEPVEDDVEPSAH